jgi:uncharacterized repeat protein (TIGR01451 family)
MKAAPGSSFILANVQPQGIAQLTSAGLSPSQLISYGYNSTNPNFLNVAFVDEDEPGLQLVSSFGTFYRVDNYIRSTVCSLNTYGSTIPADYDSQANTLYTVDYDYLNNQAYLRKTTNIATTPTNTTVSLGSLSNNVSTFLKLSKDRSALFLSNSNKLYKITNLSQSTPTATAIDNNAFPQYTSISSIDIGATDNELLVTLSNYGIQSVWYTSDGGVSWTGKDQSNYGLPDMPVRHALFNPQNRKQVFLATELGIWSTTDITATNPGWTFTSIGLGTYRVNQLRYRASDGLLTAATSGRGIWTSDALAIPYTAPTIAISNISSTSLCAGNTFTVSFTQSGPAMGSNNTYEVWISDATGSFATKRRLGSGTASPITANLPGGIQALPYGTNYRIKIVTTDPDVESEQSGPLVIGNLNSIFLTDRRVLYGLNYINSTICNGSTVTLMTLLTNNFSNSTSPDSYQWSLNGTVISNATSSTYPAGQAGTYIVTIKHGGCLASATYYLYTSNSIYSNTISQVGTAPQCADSPLAIASDYVGESATYQWARDGVDITGATSYSLITNQTGTYTHRVVDRNCTSVSVPSFYQFGQSLAVRIAPFSPGDTLLCSGSSGTRAIYLANSEYVSNTLYPLPEPYTYQWYKDGVAISGATSRYYYVFEAGLYTLSIRRGSCEARSNSILVRTTVSAVPMIENVYKSTLACSGDSRRLEVRPYNGSYQWQKDGVDIAGAIDSYYNATTSGQYTVRIGYGNCIATSTPTILTFGNQIQPYITGELLENCSNVSLTQTNQYARSDYRYQWMKDGTVIPGATNSYYNITQTGSYKLQITSGTCQGVSKGVFIKIGKPMKPTVNVPDLTTLCKDRSVRINTNFITGATYQWKRNGISLPFLSYGSLYVTQSGLYSVVVNTSVGCEAESDPVQITIGEPTAARLAGNTLISAGKSAQLPVAFTGVAPWSFTLSNGQSVQNTYQNPYMLTVTPTNTTTYSLASVNNGCGSGSVSGSSTVSVANGSADLSLNMMVNNRTPNVGDVVTYSLMLTNEGANDATGVQVASRLPTGLVFVEALSPGVMFSDGIVRADAGTVAINGLTRIQFRARVTQPGTFATAAQVTACQTPDLDSQPNSGTGDGEDDAATIDLRTASQSGSLLVSANPDQVVLPKLSGNQPVADANTADLSLTMSTNALSPKAGDVITVMLQVSNRGGSAASSIEVQTQLPASWQLASTDGLVVSGQTIKGYINQLPAGKSATINLSLRVGSTNNVLQSQIGDVAETDPDSTTGNGYDKGEDDEASIMVRQR